MRMRWAGLMATLAVAAACGGSRIEEAAGAGCQIDAKPANMSFTLKNTRGDGVRLADYKGKVVFLNFWATWCVPCRVEIPILVELRERYRDQGFEVVGVVVDDDFAKAAPYADEHRMPYPIVDATSRDDITAAFGPLKGLPSSFVIARNGMVCYEHVGVPRPRDGESLEDGIRRTFDEEIRSLL